MRLFSPTAFIFRHMQTEQNLKPIEIKIATVVTVAVIVNVGALDVLELALQKMTGGAPDFFEDELATLDVATIAEQYLEWPALLALLKSYGLHVVAIRHAKELDHAQLRGLGLSIDVQSKARPAQPEDQASPSASTSAPAIAVVAAQPAVHTPAMIIDTPVRAGQRIYARGCDLIITASVNNGAEVIADGSIHIYAPLRGRALAGARGNTDARIFTMAMQAELVSIAGIYSTFESGFPDLAKQQPVQIKLVGDSIEVSSIKTVV
ncbi:MAG: septum site-determining protein MinC [Undibacterium sp.]|nr:septum site-determining protein MinC [Undibacterium sp.]